MQMADPLTALMFAVQVMNFLKNLIVRTLKEREESVVESTPVSRLEPSDEDGHQSSFQTCLEEDEEEDKGDEDKFFAAEEPTAESPSNTIQGDSTTERGAEYFPPSSQIVNPRGNHSLVDNCPCEVLSQVNSSVTGLEDGGLTGPSGGVRTNISKSKTSLSSLSSFKKGSKKVGLMSRSGGPAEKTKGPGIVGRINSRTELVEAWR
jgi:hypothetical protein